MSEVQQNTADRICFDIPDVNLAKFQDAIAKLSRKAERLGQAPLSPVIIGHRDEKINKVNHRIYEVLFTDDEIIKVDGWTFVATLDHSPETGNIVRSLPSTRVVVPEHYRTAEPVCEHCRIRRYRRDTYVLHCEADNSFKQIGRTCLKDFFGHDPSALVRRAELLGFAAECARGWGELGDGEGTRYFWPVEEFAAHTAAMIRLYGWTSRTVARDTGKRATIDDAADSFLTAMQSHPETVVTEADYSLAREALNWADSLRDKMGKSDYEHNICAIAGSKILDQRSLGLLASIVGVYVRQVERDAQRQVAAAKGASSRHVGKEKERLRDMIVTLVRECTKPSDFGITHIYTFVSDEGNLFTWFASGDHMLDLNQRVKLTGTVKKHTEFQEVKSTVLTRCQVDAVTAQAA